MHLVSRKVIKWNGLPAIRQCAAVLRKMAPLSRICSLNQTKTADDNLQRACHCIRVRFNFSSVVVDCNKSSSSWEIVALSDDDVAMGFSIEIASIRVRRDKMEEDTSTCL